MADVQIAVIDPEDTQLALAAPAEAVVNVAVPGIQGPVGTTGSVTIAQAGTAATPGIRFESDTNTGIYSPGADQLAVSTGGTGRLFVDSSGNVGIGTSSPNNALSIVGTSSLLANASIRINSTVGTQSANSGLWITGNQSTSNYNWLIGSQYNVNNAFEITPSTAVDGATFTTPALLVTQAGRVGIGTSSPSYALHVNTAAATDVELAVQNSAGLARYGTRTSGNAFAGSFTAGKSFELWSANAQAVTIDSSGNVGIGTSSPGTALEVVNGTDNNHLTLYKTGVAGGAGPGIRFNNQNNTGGSAYIAGITAELTSGTPGSEAGALVLSTRQTSDASPQKRVYISAGGLVGIGTTSPAAKLHVETIPQAVNQSGSALFGPNTDYGLEIRNVIDGDGYPRVELRAPVAGAGPMLFFAGGATERLRIDSSGRVGIGTSSPTTLLDVNADTVRVRTARTPASASATGATGEICWDANYIYVCTATNTWRRSAISSW